ncbi:MAG: hypothetical protein J7480_08480 [Microbacteriaceae bacterium]|nr:hypothetical protein [Microbacteriaceae bacterium]
MINWMNLLIEFAVTVAAAVAIVAVVGLGIRLLATPTRPGPVGDARDEENDEVNLGGRPVLATVGAVVCFSAFAAIVLLGIWLIVPAFH